MTLGQFLPLFAVFNCLVMLAWVWPRLRALPTRADPGYDEAAVTNARRVFYTILGVSLALPVLMYLVFNFVAIEAGQLELF